MKNSPLKTNEEFSTYMTYRSSLIGVVNLFEIFKDEC